MKVENGGLYCCNRFRDEYRGRDDRHERRGRPDSGYRPGSFRRAGAGMIRGEIKKYRPGFQKHQGGRRCDRRAPGNPDHRSLCRYIGTAHPQRKAALLRICQPRRGRSARRTSASCTTVCATFRLPKGRKSCRSFRRTTLSTTRRRRPIRSGRSATNWRRRSTSYWAIRSRSTGWRWPSNGWISFRSGFS